MEDIIKVAAAAVCGGILSVVMKNWKSEFAMPVALCSGVIIILFVLDYIAGINTELTELALNYGIEISYIKIIVKVIAIAYICQFASELLTDCGAGSLALKVELAARIVIFSYAFPIAKELLSLAAKILENLQN